MQHPENVEAVLTGLAGGTSVSPFEDLRGSEKSAIGEPTVEPDAECQKLRKLQSILEIRTELASMHSRSRTIERRRRVSTQEFCDKYYSANQPVILFDLFDNSKATRVWTPQYLGEAFGDETVEVMMDRQRDPFYEMNSMSHKKMTRLSDYIALVLSGGKTNDFYLVANNHLLDRKPFAPLYNDFSWPSFLDPTVREDRVFFWLGPAGTVTPLHHDECNILLAQIRGRKLIKMIAPDFTPLLYNKVGSFSEVDPENPNYGRHPLFRSVRICEVVLHPGEALFIPVAWWHHVRALDVSISLSFTNFRFPNSFDFYAPRIV